MSSSNDFKTNCIHEADNDIRKFGSKIHTSFIESKMYSDIVARIAITSTKSTQEIKTLFTTAITELESSATVHNMINKVTVSNLIDLMNVVIRYAKSTVDNPECRELFDVAITSMITETMPGIMIVLNQLSNVNFDTNKLAKDVTENIITGIHQLITSMPSETFDNYKTFITLHRNKLLSVSLYDSMTKYVESIPDINVDGIDKLNYDWPVTLAKFNKDAIVHAFTLPEVKSELYSLINSSTSIDVIAHSLFTSDTIMNAILTHTTANIGQFEQNKLSEHGCAVDMLKYAMFDIYGVAMTIAHNPDALKDYPELVSGFDTFTNAFSFLSDAIMTAFHDNYVEEADDEAVDYISFASNADTQVISEYVDDNNSENFNSFVRNADDQDE